MTRDRFELRVHDEGDSGKVRRVCVQYVDAVLGSLEDTYCREIDVALARELVELANRGARSQQQDALEMADWLEDRGYGDAAGRLRAELGGARKTPREGI